MSENGLNDMVFWGEKEGEAAGETFFFRKRKSGEGVKVVWGVVWGSDRRFICGIVGNRG